MNDVLHILIPFYCAEATIERTIRSLSCIASGNRRRVVVIGIDDGSPDESSALFENAMSKMGDLEFRLIRKTNGGSGSARNQGLAAFTDGWVLFLDADDELQQDPVPFLRSWPDKSALLFAVELYRKGRRLRRVKAKMPDRAGFLAQVTSRNMFFSSMVIFRRERLANMFDEDLRFLEDWHFWAVNPGLFVDCAAFPETVLGRIHAGESNKSADQYNNGKYRVMAAEKLEMFWKDRIPLIVRNNLGIQKEIGRLQMGGKRGWHVFKKIPCTLSLYSKLLIYAFLFPIYKRLNPYGTGGNEGV